MGMKLLVISNRYPHEYDPWSSIFVKIQLDILKKKFEKVTVISLIPTVPKLIDNLFLRNRTSQDSYAKDYEYSNIYVHFINAIKFPGKVGWLLNEKLTIKKTIKLIEKKNIDFNIIHAHYLYLGGYVAAKVKEVFNKKLIVTGHGGDVYSLPFRSKIWEKKTKYTLQRSDHCITVSNRNRDIIINKLGLTEEKCSVIANGFDKNLFKPMRDSKFKLNTPTGKIVLLSVGDFKKIKGHNYLIRAMNIICQKRGEIYLFIVGHGPEKRNLETLIGELNLQNNVFLVCQKPHDEIPLWINACDLFVLPSLNEGVPLVLFETMGCGKPIVATSVGGIPEIMNEKIGILVNPKNEKELANAIIKALEKDWDYRYIFEYAQQFTWENISNEILNIYKKYIAIP